MTQTSLHLPETYTRFHFIQAAILTLPYHNVFVKIPINIACINYDMATGTESNNSGGWCKQDWSSSLIPSHQPLVNPIPFQQKTLIFSENLPKKVFFGTSFNKFWLIISYISYHERVWYNVGKVFLIEFIHKKYTGKIFARECNPTYNVSFKCSACDISTWKVFQERNPITSRG